MAKVMTLSGMETASVTRHERRCERVRVYVPSLGQEATICKEHLTEAMEELSRASRDVNPGLHADPTPLRRRGRPKGSKSRARGGMAKDPWRDKPTCSRHGWKRDKTGKWRCQCQNEGANRTFAPANKCGRKPLE
jgi:ribosomal protein L37AE/L43A